MSRLRQIFLGNEEIYADSVVRYPSSRAIDTNYLTILNTLRRKPGAHDCRDAVLAGHNIAILAGLFSTLFSRLWSAAGRSRCCRGDYLLYAAGGGQPFVGLVLYARPFQ